MLVILLFWDVMFMFISIYFIVIKTEFLYFEGLSVYVCLDFSKVNASLNRKMPVLTIYSIILSLMFLLMFQVKYFEYKVFWIKVSCLEAFFIF